MYSHFKEILQELQLGKPLALITIIENNGSTPRVAGTKMIVRQDGTLSGTVGGGLYEGEAIAEAKKRLFNYNLQKDISNPESLILYYDMISKQNTTDMDMICGGDLRLLIEIITPTIENKNLYASLLETQNSLATFITRLTPCNKNSQPIIAQHANLIKSCSQAKENYVFVEHALLRENATPINASILSDSLKASLESDLSANRKNLFLQNHEYCFYPINTPYRLHIFGAGHVSLELAKLTHYLNFQTHVLDDRAEFANEERFGFVKSLVLPSLDEKNVEKYLSQFEIAEKDALIIVTRGHARDRDVLISAMKTKAGYLGMIGSKSKRQATYEYLLNLGYKKEDFERIFSPIGLCIGAQTPQEIAISISAQLIQWRAKFLNKDTKYV